MTILIKGGGVNTTDSTAIAADIAAGKTAYAAVGKVVGTANLDKTAAGTVKHIWEIYNMGYAEKLSTVEEYFPPVLGCYYYNQKPTLNPLTGFYDVSSPDGKIDVNTNTNAVYMIKEGSQPISTTISAVYQLVRCTSSSPDGSYYVAYKYSGDRVKGDNLITELSAFTTQCTCNQWSLPTGAGQLLEIGVNNAWYWVEYKGTRTY